MPHHTVQPFDSNSTRRLDFLALGRRMRVKRGISNFTFALGCASVVHLRNAMAGTHTCKENPWGSFTVILVNGFPIRVVPCHAHVFVQFAGFCGFPIRGGSARVLVKCARSYRFPIRAGHQGMSLDVSGNGARSYGFPRRAGQPALGVNGPFK